MEDKHKGFTLIEVVLVLAIAGMIFAMTFAVLPTLWKNERDTERREGVLAFIRNLKSYQANNSRGALPTFARNATSEFVNGEDAVAARENESQDRKKQTEGTWYGFYRDYFNNEYQDPDGHAYNWKAMECKTTRTIAGTECENNDLNVLYNGTFADNDYTLKIVTSATCDGDHAVLSANNRRVAALYRLEGSGVYCENI